ncbi:MAG: HIT family protein [archaeon]
MKSGEDCIFCKIVNGESPCWKVYEDDKVLAFFDVYPATEGHTLVIPKKHFENIYDVPEDYLKSIISACKKISLYYKKKGIKSVNLIHGSGKNAQQDVFHFHFHIVPRKDAKKDNFKMSYSPKDKEISKNFDSLLSKFKLV